MEDKYNGDVMLQKAQQVWSMLDDMAESDPRAYKAFIDKQMADKKEFMAPPEPHMCVQTHMVKPQNVPFFINFCTWKRIPEVANPEEPVKVAGSAVSQLNEDRGKVAVTAVAFNEKILEKYGKTPVNTTDQDTLIQIAMDFIEKQHSDIKLNRKYKILERTYKGSINVIQESLFQAFKAKEKDAEKNVSNILKHFGPLATESPEALLGELIKETGISDKPNEFEQLPDKLSGITLDTKPTKRGLIEEVSSSTNSLPEPVYDLVVNNSHVEGQADVMVLKINLPGVKSVAECELDISKDDISLTVENKYELKLVLPHPALDEDTKATFNKKTSLLTVMMPITWQ